MSPRCSTLANGLRVVLAPCEAESAAFGLFVASGSRHESAKTAGISHFIEHMLFKGTPTRRPIDITRAIEGRGGNFNACTGEESTCYFAHLPDEYIGEAIDILSDMYLNASIDAGELELEKGVVIDEIKMYDDEPDSVAAENLQRALFPGSMLGAPVAGSEKTLRPMTPEMLKNYIASHYLPANTVAVVVGKFDEDEVAGRIEKNLGLRRSRRGGLKTDDPFRLPRVESVVAEREVKQTQLAIGYRTFGVGDSRRYAAAMMDAMLGRGMSSRLFQEVREKRGMSYDIASRLQFFSDAGMFVVTAGVDSKKAEAALKTIDRELEKMRAKGVSAAELKRTKEYIAGNFKLSRERTVSKLFFYGQAILSFGRIVTFEEQLEGFRSVSAADVKAVAEEILRPENRSVSRVVPK
ncbi:MAG: insulinase family protein [Kiritimatiellae bacterium]|nr:insulinase family protein [Kiritimatiellia bacterium]